MNENAPPAVCAAGLLVECWPKILYADRGPPRLVRFSSFLVIAVAQRWVEPIASISKVD